MDKSFKIALFSALLITLSISSASAQTCKSNSLSSNNRFATCVDLPVLNSYLHWNYHQTNGTVDIAYRHSGVTTSNWVAWALNLDSKKMKGSQALVALQNSSGPYAYTSSMEGDVPTLAQSSLSFDVSSLTAEYSGSEMIIYATLVLPSNRTSFNQLWQIGPVSGNTPQSHTVSGDNLQSAGTVDFASGQTTASSGGNSKLKKKNVHGILNAISWGILMPLGAMIARYLKVFKKADPAWFYLHVACQSSAYAIGVAGWATGMKLGSDSPGVEYDTHRNIGITLFCLGTLQVFALLLRPKKDHKFRFYWNLYHWGIGYAVIILSIVNIFEGLDILDPSKNWKRAYVSILICLGFNAVMLEAYTWYLVYKRKKTESVDKYPHVGNGVNGYGTRPQHTV